MLYRLKIVQLTSKDLLDIVNINNGDIAPVFVELHHTSDAVLRN